MRISLSKTFLVLTFCGIILLAMTPLLVSAQTINYEPLAPIPNTSAGGGGVDLTSYLVGIYKTGIAVASVLAVLMIVWGGFTYISTDAIGNKSEGKTYIQNALLGLVLVFGSFLILETINPALVDLNLSFKPVGKNLKQVEYTARTISRDEILENVYYNTRETTGRDENADALEARADALFNTPGLTDEYIIRESTELRRQAEVLRAESTQIQDASREIQKIQTTANEISRGLTEIASAPEGVTLEQALQKRVDFIASASDTMVALRDAGAVEQADRVHKKYTEALEIIDEAIRKKSTAIYVSEQYRRDGATTDPGY